MSSVMGDESFQYHVDSPAQASVIDDLNFVIRGWVRADSRTELGAPVLIVDDVRKLPLAVARRDDVRRTFPDQSVLGFEGAVSITDLPPGFRAATVSLLVNGREEFVPLEMNFADGWVSKGHRSSAAEA